MLDYLYLILPKFEHLGLWGYWLILFVSFAESFVFIGSFIPGATIVIFFGFLSSIGYLDIGDLIWFAAIGAILGDSFSYWLGTKGIKFFQNENKILKKVHLEKGEAFFKKHGGKSILLGRFISFLRSVTPFVAGLTKMSPLKFISWDILTAFIWAPAHLLVGYFFGNSLQTVHGWSAKISIFIITITLAIVITRVIRNIYRKRKLVINQ